jgi:microcystin-dependent protein
MSEPFLGEMRIFSFANAPRGWAQCNGQLLPINQNQALFSLLGTMYGGNGQTNFALPNLQNRVPMHLGSGHTQGESAGEANHTLTVNEVPTHLHVAQASSAAANANAAAGNVLAVSQGNIYLNPNQTSPQLTPLHPSTTASTGGSQAHNNTQPLLVLNVCVALQGVFPSQT